MLEKFILILFGMVMGALLSAVVWFLASGDDMDGY